MFRQVLISLRRNVGTKKLAIGVGVAGGTLAYVSIIRKERQTARGIPWKPPLLTPAKEADTLQMGLYLTSRREWEEQERQRRQDILDTYEGRWKKLNTILRQLQFRYNDYVVVPLQTLIRALQLTCIFIIPVLVSHPVLTTFYDSQSWYKLIRFVCQMAGPSFIKLGQWASSRTDLFAPEFCSIMSTLHSNVTPHSWEYTNDMLCDLLKVKDLSEIFESIDQTPIGCGSIAQVYKARWKGHDTNDYIALKVLHPNVINLINMDCHILQILANGINKIPTMEWLSFAEEVKNFTILMNIQLDLRIEAINLDKFNMDFHDNPLIKFPKPDIKWTSRNVLFEEYVEALPLQSILNFKNKFSSKELTKVSSPFVMAFLNMMILNNFVHTDLHPGNIMVCGKDKDSITNIQKLKSLSQEDPNFVKGLSHFLKTKPIQICLIDVGLVTELNSNNRTNFIDLFQALTKFDGILAGNLMIERSRTPQTAINPEEFTERVNKLIHGIKKQTFSLGNISIGGLLNEMLSMVRQHHVKMEPDFVSIVVAILLLEGVGRQLDPELDLFESSIPLLSRYYREKYIAAGGEMVKVSDKSLLEGTTTSQMFVIWVGLHLRKFINVSLRQINHLLKSDQLSPNY